MDEGSRRLPELVHLGGLLFGQGLRVQREGRRAGQLALLLVLPGLQGALERLGRRTGVARPPLSRGARLTATVPTGHRQADSWEGGHDSSLPWGGGWAQELLPIGLILTSKKNVILGTKH